MSVIALIIFLVWQFVGEMFIYSGNNMFPAVRDGDLCITYKLEDYVTGDVVAYEYDGEAHLGRIVAKEGDKVEITDAGILLVNGYQPSESIYYSTGKSGSKINYPYTVKEDEVFVLNDFRTEMTDSRITGSLSESDLKGKVVFIIRRRGI